MRLFQPPLMLLLLANALLSTSHAATSEQNAKALIDWVQSKKGGYVSPKIEVRRMFPDDEGSPMGVYAKEDIEEKETLLKIPRHLYLGLSKDEVKDTAIYDDEQASAEEIMKVYFENTCRLAKKLLKEWDLYEENPVASEYGPFMAYLQTQPTGQIPATYKKGAKALLRKISGPLPKGATPSPNYGNYSLPPGDMVDWIDRQFVQRGCLEEGDEKGYHAVALVIQRGYDSELIPVWDLVNHDNHRLNVATNSLRSQEGLHVWAKEEIKAGEEIFATYNYCTDCYDIGDDWGTPGIFRDFGFVEDLESQQWSFLDHEIQFELEEDEETGNVVAIFERDPDSGEITYGLPDEEGLEYLKTELHRLAEFNFQKELLKLKKEKLGMKPHELQMIRKYYRSLLIALTAGLETTTKEHLKATVDPAADEL